MPTYTVALANLSLTSEQESAIAAAITEIHHISTGAPGFFAQVFFVKIPPGKHYIGGRICQAPHMFVHALIRAGRSADTKLSLLKDITTKIRKTAGLGPENIWVYIQDIPAEQMVEFGRVLPEPGGEEEWCRGISTKKIRELSDAGALG